jgi:hypothetical protein
MVKMKEEKIKKKYMDIKNYTQTLHYFESWGNKEIDSLKDLFADSIELRDWTNTWIGKDNVVNANLEIFKLNEIKLTVINVDVCSKTSYCQLEIIVNGDLLKVLDVIEFNEENLISKITAYKG